MIKQHAIPALYDLNLGTKFQAIGTALKVRVWQADSVEPNDWTIETTDSSLTSGYVGVGSLEASSNFAIDYFGVDSSEIGLPEVYEDDDYFSACHIPTTTSASFNFARAMGGQFIDANR